MSTPDVTKAQIVALVQAVLGVAVAFGAPVSNEQSTAILALAGTLGVVLVIADAAIRRGRAQHIAPLDHERDLFAAEGAAYNATAELPLDRPRGVPLDLQARLAAEAEADAAAQKGNGGDPPPAHAYGAPPATEEPSETERPSGGA